MKLSLFITTLASVHAAPTPVEIDPGFKVDITNTWDPAIPDKNDAVYM